METEKKQMKRSQKIQLGGVKRQRVKSVKNPLAKRFYGTIKVCAKTVAAKVGEYCRRSKTPAKNRVKFAEKQVCATRQRQNIFQDFENSVKSECNAVKISAYCSDGAATKKVYGETLENAIVIEKYFSFANTVILINPNGLADNAKYKCRYVTRIFTRDTAYLLCVSSYVYEAFRGGTSEKITRKTTDLIRRISELKGL
jgi:hypothetical protein